jgi:hypothetical protein
MTTLSLRARLLIWACARSWRGALIVDAALLVASLGMGDVAAIAPALCAATILWFSLNAMGVLIYALFPYRFDDQGPLFFVRLVAAIALLTPVAAGSLVAMTYEQSVGRIALYASVLLSAEAFLSLEAAAWRFRRDGGVHARVDS